MTYKATYAKATASVAQEAAYQQLLQTTDRHAEVMNAQEAYNAQEQTTNAQHKVQHVHTALMTQDMPQHAQRMEHVQEELQHNVMYATNAMTLEQLLIAYHIL